MFFLWRIHRRKDVKKEVKKSAQDFRKQHYESRNQIFTIP